MLPNKQFLPQYTTIGIVGLGYVGLPLLLAFARKGFNVIGFDIDQKKINLLKQGKSYISHISSADIELAISDSRFQVTNDFAMVSVTDAVIICVPTPVSVHLEPDLSFVRTTLDSICPFLKKGHVVCLESTSYPGTTEEEVVPRLSAMGLVSGESVFIVYSPEREDPGNSQFSFVSVPKIISGITPACLEVGLAVYRGVFDTLVPVSSCKVAELSKLLENIYRAVNIGLVNEMKIVADAMEIDIWEVIRAASTKPFGFTTFYPGPGLGGHCIPIDPFYLTWKAKEHGVHTRFVELAGQVNRSMPEYVVNRTMIALNEKGKAVKGARILLLGLAYKADVGDVRESATFELMNRFVNLGAEVAYHDPHVPVIFTNRRNPQWEGMKSLPWNEEVLGSFDVVVIATNHKCFDLRVLARIASLIIDTRNAMAGIEGPGIVVKA